MEYDLKNKTVLVTGGGRGIGRAIAKKLAAAGAVVAINYASNEQAARETVEMIREAGGTAFSVKASIGTPEATEALFATLDKEFTKRTGSAGIDILVNNAATAEFLNVQHTPIDAFDRIFQVNVRGTFLVTQAAIERMHDNGRIITITSGVVRLATPDMAAYTMSKAALDSFSRILAQELANKHITANAVSPGWTDTDAVGPVLQNKDYVKQLEADTAMGRIGKPEDIAAVVAFLVSPQGEWVTGQTIDASGGYRL